MDIDLDRMIRPHLKDLPLPALRPGPGLMMLDANENSFGSPLVKWQNRYPDPLQQELRQKIAAIKKTGAGMIFLGNGAAECIDLLLRCFCDPAFDNIIVCPPGYEGYQAAARINGIAAKLVPLTPAFQLDMEGLEQAIDAGTRMLFLCSPNNPTGNSLDREEIEMVLNNFDGIVVLDEAYINYSRHRSFLAEISDYPNLVVLQTFSTAWGMAGVRLCACFAASRITQVLNSMRHSHIGSHTQELALKALDGLNDVNELIRAAVRERENLRAQLAALPQVVRIYPSEANFLLVRFHDGEATWLYLREHGIAVYNCSHLISCENCLRITIGMPEQNSRLVETLKKQMP